MKIRPILNRVVVKQLEAATTTAGGLIIPGKAQRRPLEGIVVAVGPGKVNSKGERVFAHEKLKEGDRVLFGRYAGHEVQLKAEKEFEDISRYETFRILQDTEILGVEEKPTTPGIYANPVMFKLKEEEPK